MKRPLLFAALLGAFSLTSSTTAAFADPGPAAETKKTQPADEQRATADHYRQLMFNGQFDALGDLMPEQALFIDPTADALDLPLAQGIQGRQTIIDEHKSWGVGHFAWSERLRFASGAYDIAYGLLELETATFPFLNILKFEAGQVAERVDYGDYKAFTRRLAEQTAEPAMQALAETARRYLEAYARDFDAMQALLAEDAVFRDPTSEIFGGGMGADAVQGAAAIADWFRRSATQAENFELTIQDAFYSLHHAVFITRASADLLGQVTGHFAGPLIIVLEIRDGQVVKHHDYWQAERFLEHMRENTATAPAASTPTSSQAPADAGLEESLEESLEQHRAGLARIFFLRGTWQGQWQSFSQQAWGETSELEGYFEPTMKEKYLQGAVEGAGYRWLISYDQVQDRYRMSSIDEVSGLLDIYEGSFDAEGRLVLDNLESGTLYLEHGTKIHNRLTLAAADGGFHFGVEATEDLGQTWIHQVRMAFGTELPASE